MDAFEVKSHGKLVAPYGGRLTDLLVHGEEREELEARANGLSSIQLSPRSLCDIELLATGAFSPLDRFMNRADYARVLEDLRLEDGMIFPIPVTLPVNAHSVRLDAEICLRSPNNDLIALMQVEEIFEWNHNREAGMVFGTTDVRHPVVAQMSALPGHYATGALKVLTLPRHYDFAYLRKTPSEIRKALERLGHNNVVAFQTRNPIHRADEELTRRAAAEVDGTLLIQAVVGMTNPGDVDHYTRVRAYKVLVERYFDASRTMLDLLPLAMRMAGPREAVWHAIIHRNYGANYFVVDGFHAAPGNDSNGHPFYGSQDALGLLQKFENDLGIKAVPYKRLVYLPEHDRYEEAGNVPRDVLTAAISRTEERAAFLGNGQKLPEWFTRPETASILSQVSPPKHLRGFCLWLTGFSGAGKSTTAEILATLFMQYGRQVTLLDGDVVRTHLSKGLGFSKEDRDVNIRRIGFVATEIVRHDGIVVCAAVSPYKAARNECRSMIGASRFIEVFVDTPIEICEWRDTKGMYAKARRGEIKGFTGVDDPYEPPDRPEIRLTTTDCSAEDNAYRIIRYLIAEGFLLDEVDERNYL